MTFLFSSIGLNSDQATKFACMMGFAPHCVEPAADFFMKMYNLFIDKDITMLEINPLTEISTGEGKVGSRHSSSLWKTLPWSFTRHAIVALH